jgi:hypothetical protein
VPKRVQQLRTADVNLLLRPSGFDTAKVRVRLMDTVFQGEYLFNVGLKGMATGTKSNSITHLTKSSNTKPTPCYILKLREESNIIFVMFPAPHT